MDTTSKRSGRAPGPVPPSRGFDMPPMPPLPEGGYDQRRLHAAAVRGAVDAAIDRWLAHTVLQAALDGVPGLYAFLAAQDESHSPMRRPVRRAAVAALRADLESHPGVPSWLHEALGRWDAIRLASDDRSASDPITQRVDEASRLRSMLVELEADVAPHRAALERPRMLAAWPDLRPVVLEVEARSVRRLTVRPVNGGAATTFARHAAGDEWRDADGWVVAAED